MEMTCTEETSLEDEVNNQQSYREPGCKKVIFIIADLDNEATHNMTPGIATLLAKHHIPLIKSALAGDINLFFGRNNDDPKEAELSIMIAE